MAGDLVHFEIPADDSARARQFYGDLFGWQFSEQPGPTEYWISETSAGPSLGLIPRAGRERRPLLYFEVADIDAATARVEALGGAVSVPKTAVPGKGWLVKFTDPERNLFGLWAADTSA